MPHFVYRDIGESVIEYCNSSTYYLYVTEADLSIIKLQSYRYNAAVFELVHGAVLE